MNSAVSHLRDGALRSPRSEAGFTLVELLVATTITAVLAGVMVAIVANVSGFWGRTSGRASAESQARFVLDQIALDLQSALYRDDGAVWLAATIPANTGNTGLWNTTGATTNALKPANNAGSLQGIATGAIDQARFRCSGSKNGSASATDRTTFGSISSTGTKAPDLTAGFRVIRSQGL